VTEVQGMEGDTVVLQDIFTFNQSGFRNGRVVGNMKATGLRPNFVAKFAVNNVEVSPTIFETI
jgi:pilus assembly protein CpaF